MTYALIMVAALFAIVAPAGPVADEGSAAHDLAVEALSEGQHLLVVEAEASAALESFGRAAEIAGDIEDEVLLADALTWLAEAHFELGEMNEGLDLATNALEHARRSGDAHTEGWALLGVGDARFHLGEMERARESFERARELFTAVGDAERLADARKSLGAVLKALGLNEDAVAELEAARSTYRSLGQWHSESSAAEILAEAWYRLGEGNRALATLEEVLTIAEQQGSDRLAAQALIRIGVLYLWFDRPEKALDNLERAVAAGRRLRSPPLVSWALQNLGLALAQLGHLDEALSLRLEALEITREITSPYYLALGLIDLGSLYRLRDPRRALDYSDEALAILTRLDYPERWPVRYARARALRLLGAPDQAIESLELAVDELERVRSRLASLEHRAAFADQHHAVYRELVDALLERSAIAGGALDAERAFEVTEQARARSLIEAMAESRLGVGRPAVPELAARERVLEGSLAALQRRLIEMDGQDGLRNSLLADLGRDEVEMDQVVTDIRKHDPRYAAVRYPEPVSAAGAMQLVGDGTAMVSYFVTGAGLAAFVLSGDHLVALRLSVDARALERRIDNYVDLLARGVGRDVWLPTGLRLERDLLAPVREVLPPDVRRLIVVPDGALHFLPFETLARDDGGSVRLLVEEFGVSYAPSATALEQIAHGSTAGAQERIDLLLFADPSLPLKSGPGNARALTLFEDEGVRVPSIPYSAAEARAVRRIVGGRSRVYTGEGATEKRLKEEAGAQIRVLHLATHGLVSLRDPGRSALLLAASPGDGEDGLLQAREIWRLELGGALVVLSACRSAQGRLLEGEGVQGLARAFLHAGARAVVASMWDVDDEQTAGFMRAFYRRLVEGMPAGDALRAAQLDRRRSSPESAWTPFVLIGDAAAPALAPHGRWPASTPLWLAFAAAGGIVLWLARPLAAYLRR